MEDIHFDMEDIHLVARYGEKEGIRRIRRRNKEDIH